jgi:toxin ParE1/3/4
MYRLHITELAEQDLDGIVNYMAVELANPIAARAFLEKIEDCYAHLKTKPGIYAECEDTYLRSKGYRKALIGNYLLIFRIEERTKRDSHPSFFLWCARLREAIVTAEADLPYQQSAAVCCPVKSGTLCDDRCVS